jgi:acyl dehydratase
MKINFSDFKIGDYIYFSKKFSRSDFEKFKDLSGDNNILHFDKKYADRTIFKKPILPMHMACLPLSRIAGMYFPGEPSLYLQHTVKAIKPTFYDEELIYSAVLKDINYTLRVMTLNVLVIRNEIEVAIEGQMYVQSRDDEWLKSNNCLEKRNKNLLVLGLNEVMMDAIFSRFLKNGWCITIAIADCLDSNSIDKWAEIYPGKINFLSPLNAKKRNIHNEKKNTIYSTLISSILIINDAKIENHKILQSVLNEYLPKFLKEQNGQILSIFDSGRLEDEDYKIDFELIAYQIEKIKKNYSKYGIVCDALFFDIYQDLELEEFVELLEDRFTIEPTELLVDDSASEGGLFLDGDVGENETQDQNYEGRIKNEIKGLIIKLFDLPKNYEWKSEGLGVTPGWDSFGHILVLLEVEKRMGVKFKSVEYESTYEFENFTNVVLSRHRSSR